MTNNLSVEALEVLLYGTDVPQKHRATAAELLVAGDDVGAERFLKKADAAQNYIDAREKERARQSAINPNLISLYAGISGISMGEPEVSIAPGLTLSRTFAHVMSHNIMAFQRPIADGAHPGPWKPAKGGGVTFDIELELSLDSNSRPTGFDRLNSIWWFVALLRLHHAVGIRAPIVSDTPFAVAATADQEPVLWSIETNQVRMRFDDPKDSPEVAPCVLDWLRVHYVRSAALMNDSRFALAFRALEDAQQASSSSSAMLMIWSALEALFRPGKPNTTQKLCSSIATHLQDCIRERDKVYQQAKQLYVVRGEITHAAERPDFADVRESFLMARACFLRTLEAGSLPDGPALVARWKARA